MDAVLKSENIAVERKNFIFDLRENPRGRFLRITEDANGRRDSIVIPAPGLEEFRRVLDEIIAAHRERGRSVRLDYLRADYGAGPEPRQPGRSMCSTPPSPPPES